MERKQALRYQCSFNSGLALTKLLKAQVAASSRSLLLLPEPLLTVRSHPPGEGHLTQGGGHTYIPGKRSVAGGFSCMKLTCFNMFSSQHPTFSFHIHERHLVSHTSPNRWMSFCILRGVGGLGRFNSLPSGQIMSIVNAPTFTLLGFARGMPKTTFDSLALRTDPSALKR